MCSDLEKKKRPCKQNQVQKVLTDTEAKQVCGGVSVPGASSSQPGDGVYVPKSSFVMGGGVIDEEKQANDGGVSVPITPPFNMNGGAI